MLEIRDSVAEWLKTQRTAHGLSITQLARLSGVSRRTIRRYEATKRTLYTKLDCLAAVFDEMENGGSRAAFIEGALSSLSEEGQKTVIVLLKKMSTHRIYWNTR